MLNPRRVNKDDRPARRPASASERRAIVYPIDVIREQHDVIEQWLVGGVSLSGIEKAAKKRWGIKGSRVRRIVDKVRGRWIEETRAERPHWKAQAIRRVYGHIAAAREASQWNAVAQFERLLAEMQGTKEPLEIALNVDRAVSEAALHAVAQLSPERIRQIADEQRQLRLLAARAVIETPGTLVNETVTAPK